jgi:hypothetical protein
VEAKPATHLCRDVRDYSKLINIGNTNEEEIFTYKYIYFYSYLFLLTSQLGTVVASVYTHAPYTHHLYTNKPITILRSEDRVLLEITEIL